MGKYHKASRYNRISVINALIEKKEYKRTSYTDLEQNREKWNWLASEDEVDSLIQKSSS